MTFVPEHLPDYVELNGRQVWRAPYTARNATVYGFVMPADRIAIEALLQKALVEPAGNAVDYRCAHDHVLFTFADIEKMASGEPPDDGRGHMRERELSIWCLAADMHAPGRLVWYLPYVFTDTGQTVATGREVYGYPKQMGAFSRGYPAKLDVGGVTTVRALSIDQFPTDQPAELRTMVSVNRRLLVPRESETVPAGDTLFEEFENMFPGKLEATAELPFGSRPPAKAVITRADAPPPLRTPPAPPWVRRVLDAFEGKALSDGPFDLVTAMATNPTLVFLKQFRDASCTTKACYQAIIEAPLAVHVTQSWYTPLKADLFTVTVEDWASHPIASDLGITTSKPVHAFRATLDFDIQLGYEVWRAPA